MPAITDKARLIPAVPLEAIGLPALIADMGGVIRAVNAAMRDFLGCPDAQIEGIPIERLLSGKKDWEAITAFLSDEDIMNGVAIGMAAADGSNKFVSISAGVVRDVEGRPLLVTLIARDLSSHRERVASLAESNRGLKERVAFLEDFRKGVFEMLKDIVRSEGDLERALKELKETQEKLIQSSKLSAIGEFSAGVVHELHQPLTVIKGISNGIYSKLRAEDPEREKMKLVVDAAARMERVIKHLLLFSRGGEPEYEVFDVNSAVKDALILTKDQLLKDSVEVRTDLTEVSQIYGSPGRIEQVVLNLIANARDAMPGGGTIEITTVEVVKDGRKGVRLTVRDTGCGIKGEEMEKIFDPFFTTKEPGKGTGLGLSISYGIIKEHKGEITVESVPGDGAVFSITLPALKGAGR